MPLYLNLVPRILLPLFLIFVYTLSSSFHRRLSSFPPPWIYVRETNGVYGSIKPVLSYAEGPHHERLIMFAFHL